VVHDEDPCGARGDAEALEHAFQLLPIEGLSQDISGSKREAHLPPVHDADHDDRDVPVRFVLLQLAEHGPAVLAGHEDVERDQPGAQLAREPHPLVTAPGHRARVSLALARAPDHVLGDGIIVDHENARALRGSDRRRRLAPGRCVRVVNLSRHPDRKRRTPPRLALDLDRAAHHLAEALGDREPEAGPAVVAGRRGVRLGELLEDRVDLVPRG
jgi:hypothetical protein